MTTPVNAASSATGNAVVGELRAALPEGRVIVDPDVARSLSRDQAAGAPAGEPAAVVRARSTEEVRRVVEVCLRHRTPVVARGAGTGLSGGANAVDGCVVLSPRADGRRSSRSTRWNGSPWCSRAWSTTTCGPRSPSTGSGTRRTRRARRGRTIGGNVATNAGGLCCVKYGVTRDYVLGLEVVTGTGERGAHRPPDRQGRRRLRPGRPARRLRGNAGHRHRDHRAAA